MAASGLSQRKPKHLLLVRRTADPSASPDFVLGSVALANFMRLSLLKGAHADLSCAAWQEIRVRSELVTFLTSIEVCGWKAPKSICQQASPGFPRLRSGQALHSAP